MRRVRNLFASVVLATASSLAVAQDNVLVILADDLGVDYLDTYGEGSQPAPTPTLSTLAARGVLFRNAWAHPSCSPSRASIITGRHAFRHMLGRWIRYPSNTEPIGTLRADEWTLPEVLDRARSGYAHACIGKWHMSEVGEGLLAPNDPGGFQTYVGALTGQLPSYYSWPRVENGVERTTANYATTQTTDDAIQWIQAQTGPWFCYLAYNAPHLPFEAPPAHLHTQVLTGTPASNPRAYYRAMIEAMDTEIGRLFASLGNELASTHVIFLADNGSVQNMAVPPFDPARAKGSPYEGGLNVPMIVAGPAVQQPGREVSALTSVVDVFSTVLDLANARQALPSWIDVDSVSLLPYLTNPNQPALRSFTFSEEFTGDVWPRPNQNGHADVRDDRYKLIHRYSGGAHEVFDLVSDPFETRNLLAVGMTPGEQAAYVSLLNELSRLRTPRARFTTLGMSCTGSSGVPSLGASGSPAIPSNFELVVSGAAPGVPVSFLLGFSEDRWLGLDLPIDLSNAGAGPLCQLAIAPDVTLPSSANGVGEARLSLPIPNLREFVGAYLFHQALLLDANAPSNALGVVTTNHAASLLGL